MELRYVKNLEEVDSSLHTLILPFWQEKSGAKPAFSGHKSFEAAYSSPLKAGDFLGKEGETLFVYPAKGKEKRFLLLGLGRQSECHHDSIRTAFAKAMKACKHKRDNCVGVFIPEWQGQKTSAIAGYICEGMLLANYTFDVLKNETAKETHFQLNEICLIGADKNTAHHCDRVEKVISSVYFARDLINLNADDVTPQHLAQVAKQMAKEFSSLRVHVLDKEEIEKEKMGLLLAVSRGASIPPVLITLEYRGDPKSKDRTALVGKGITYDTGGLNLKTSGMETMKGDMAGAAAVLGTLRAAASLKLKRNIVGVIPATENAIGPRSFKPGDVYRARSGKTVEIGDTDAEGRLVLADAISYAQDKFSPSRIIDLATLTGGIVIALGEEVTGLFCNDDDLSKQLQAAGEKTFERLWPFPLYPEFKELLKSSVADIRNAGGGRKASSIKGGIFIQSFVKNNTPWAHLDIAGTGFISEMKPYLPTPGTAVGIRLLIEFLESL